MAWQKFRMVLAAPLELLLTTWYFRFTAVLLFGFGAPILRNRRSTAVSTFNYLRDTLLVNSNGHKLNQPSTRELSSSNRAAPMIEHLQGREKALEPFGWTGHEAEWIVLVCLHSGVFTRAQFCFHLSTSRMRALRFVRLLVSQGIAAEIPMPDRDNRRPAGRPPHICRISNRQIYQALGAENIRPGKTASPEILMRGLLSLDYVLEHTELAWLPTEREKVRCFETLDLDRRLLPRRVYQGQPGRDLVQYSQP